MKWRSTQTDRTHVVQPYGDGAQNWTNVCNHLEYDSDLPLVLMSNFNISYENIELLRAYLQKFFKHDIANDMDKPTTQRKTCIDLTFLRGIQIISLSIHNKIILLLTSLPCIQ